MKRLLFMAGLLVAIAVVAAPASARLAHYPVNVSVNGNGTVTGSDSEGHRINCPGTCSALMKQNESITLNASPAEGWSFVGWGGECSGTGSCTFNHPDGTSVQVSATFDNPGPFNLTVSRVGSGSGSVSGGPISCPSTCSASVAKGTTVNLTASPTAPSTFEGWGGACSGTGGCSVTMDSAKSVTAQFSAPAVPTYLLTVSKAGSGTGTVTGGGIDCGVTCAASVPQGSTVTLSAAPGDGATFTGWSAGPCSGTGVCTFTMNASTSVTATFGATPTTSPPPPPPPPPPGAVRFTVQKVGAGSGYVGGAGGIDCGPSCAVDVQPGTVMAVVASAAAGSRFVTWGGECAAKPACSVTVSTATTLTARFEKARDSSRPKVKAFKARGRKGGLARLRYRATDAGGGALRLTATVLSRSRVISTLPRRRSSAPSTSSFSWRVPLRPPPGLQFCVRARDAAGNLSKKACAPILVG